MTDIVRTPFRSDSRPPLPPRVEWGGYVYIASFTNGTTKPGATRCPSLRLKAHQENAESFGVDISAYWVSPWHDRHLETEQRLIEAALKLGGRQTRREYFEGVDIEDLVRFARTLPFPPVDVDALERDLESRVSRWRVAFRNATSSPETARQHRIGLIRQMFGFAPHEQTFRLAEVARDGMSVEAVENLADAIGCSVEEVLDWNYIDVVRLLVEGEVRQVAMELEMFAIKESRRDLLVPIGDALVEAAMPANSGATETASRNP